MINEIKDKKIIFLIVGIAILVIGVVGVTYAFFNYTRTGSQNIIKTGRIYFNSEQGTAINLINLFPVDPTETGVMDDATKVGTVTINVIGDTTYSGGIEYLVSAVNVQNSVGNKSLPISIQVSVEDNNENNPSTSLGTSDTDYFTNRGTSAQTSIYKVLASDVIKNNDQLVVGYIKSGQDGVDGNIVIKAYIDKNKIAISDTYPGSSIGYKYNTNRNTSDISNCVTYLISTNGEEIVGETVDEGETYQTFCSGNGTLDGATLQEYIDGGYLSQEILDDLEDINILIYENYENGTSSEWVSGRTVLTTTEWNSLQQNEVSFQVKVEANEGIWVQKPSKSIASCSDCKFMYYVADSSDVTTVKWTTWNQGIWDNTNSKYVRQIPTQITSGLYDNYEELMATTGKSYFLGVKLNNNNEVTNAYACGVKDGVPFCIEGTSDGSKYTANQTLLQGANLYNNSCSVIGYGYDYVQCESLDNSGSLSASAYSRGLVLAGVGDSDYCSVGPSGAFGCYESGNGSSAPDN